MALALPANTKLDLADADILVFGRTTRWLRQRGKTVKPKLTEEQKRELKDCFNLMDLDGSGSIDATELEEAFVLLGIDVTHKEAAAIYSQVDRDGSGTLDYNEFLEVMTETLKSLAGRQKAKGKARLPFALMSTAYRRKRYLGSLKEEVKIQTAAQMAEAAALLRARSRPRSTASRINSAQKHAVQRLSHMQLDGDLIQNLDPVQRQVVSQVATERVMSGGLGYNRTVAGAGSPRTIVALNNAAAVRGGESFNSRSSNPTGGNDGSGDQETLDDRNGHRTYYFSNAAAQPPTPRDTMLSAHSPRHRNTTSAPAPASSLHTPKLIPTSLHSPAAAAPSGIPLPGLPPQPNLAPAFPAQQSLRTRSQSAGRGNCSGSDSGGERMDRTSARSGKFATSLSQKRPMGEVLHSTQSSAQPSPSSSPRRVDSGLEPLAHSGNDLEPLPSVTYRTLSVPYPTVTLPYPSPTQANGGQAGSPRMASASHPAAAMSGTLSTILTPRSYRETFQESPYHQAITNTIHQKTSAPVYHVSTPVKGSSRPASARMSLQERQEKDEHFMRMRREGQQQQEGSPTGLSTSFTTPSSSSPVSTPLSTPFMGQQTSTSATHPPTTSQPPQPSHSNHTNHPPVGIIPKLRLDLLVGGFKPSPVSTGPPVGGVQGCGGGGVQGCGDAGGALDSARAEPMTTPSGPSLASSLPAGYDGAAQYMRDAQKLTQQVVAGYQDAHAAGSLLSPGFDHSKILSVGDSPPLSSSRSPNACYSQRLPFQGSTSARCQVDVASYLSPRSGLYSPRQITTTAAAEKVVQRDEQQRATAKASTIGRELLLRSNTSGL